MSMDRLEHFPALGREIERRNRDWEKRGLVKTIDPNSPEMKKYAQAAGDTAPPTPGDAMADAEARLKERRIRAARRKETAAEREARRKAYRERTRAYLARETPEAKAKRLARMRERARLARGVDVGAGVDEAGSPP